MTRIISALADISRNYRAVFCDLWGCLHNGETVFPAAVAALRQFRAEGGVVVLLTNAPRPASSVLAQLDRLGAPKDCYDLVVSSGDATQIAVFSGAAGQRIHFIGAEKDMSFFTERSPEIAAMADSRPALQFVPLDQAESIICTGLADDLTETPDDYRAQLLMGKTLGLPMFCANPDIVVDMGHKRVYCAGALAKAYEDMGAKAHYFGKPHPPIYDLARRQMAQGFEPVPNSEILCIGDGPWTDVLGGQGEGMDTLFIAGGIAAAHFGADPARPDPALLEQWLATERLAPTYAMGHLS